MNKLSRSDLWSLEEYAERRDQFKQELIAHKKNRQLAIGPNATIYFEDRLTIQYHIQEMLRIERIFEADGINEELNVYNPLIPDGSNWKATFMVEFEDVDERRKALSKLTGIEETIWLQIGDYDKIKPFYDEDLERTNENKTSAVHFLRFELSVDMIRSLQVGANLAAGISHTEYNHIVDPIADEIRTSLLQDLS